MTASLIASALGLTLLVLVNAVAHALHRRRLRKEWRAFLEANSGPMFVPLPLSHFTTPTSDPHP